MRPALRRNASVLCNLVFCFVYWTQVPLMREPNGSAVQCVSCERRWPDVEAVSGPAEGEVAPGDEPSSVRGETPPPAEGPCPAFVESSLETSPAASDDRAGAKAGAGAEAERELEAQEEGALGAPETSAPSEDPADLLAERMVQGWALLQSSCPICGTLLLRKRGTDLVECVKCRLPVRTEAQERERKAHDEQEGKKREEEEAAKRSALEKRFPEGSVPEATSRGGGDAVVSASGGRAAGSGSLGTAPATAAGPAGALASPSAPPLASLAGQDCSALASASVAGAGAAAATLPQAPVAVSALQSQAVSRTPRAPALHVPAESPPNPTPLTSSPRPFSTMDDTHPLAGPSPRSDLPAPPSARPPPSVSTSADARPFATLHRAALDAAAAATADALQTASATLRAQPAGGKRTLDALSEIKAAAEAIRALDDATAER